MTDLNNLDALIAALESAKEPSRELDFAIHGIVMGDWLRANGYVRDGGYGYVTETPPLNGAYRLDGPQKYTASLDAITGLVDETYPKAVTTIDQTWHDNGRTSASAQITLDGRDYFGLSRPTRALALCLAFARALKERGAA